MDKYKIDGQNYDRQMGRNKLDSHKYVCIEMRLIDR